MSDSPSRSKGKEHLPFECVLVDRSRKGGNAETTSSNAIQKRPKRNGQEQLTRHLPFSMPLGSQSNLHRLLVDDPFNRAPIFDILNRKVVL